jgi:hypothetical protein
MAFEYIVGVHEGSAVAVVGGTKCLFGTVATSLVVA